MLGGVAPFEALRQAARFGGRKGFVKRSLAVDIEIVLDQNDHGGAGKAMIGQLFLHMSIIDRGMAVGALTWRRPSRGANTMNELAVQLRS